MNSEEKETIKIYRRQGYSYEKTSKLLNISESTIASHCKRHGIRATPSEKHQKTSEHQEERLFCKWCGVKLIQTKRGVPKKFCSDACIRSWWKKMSRN